MNSLKKVLLLLVVSVSMTLSGCEMLKDLFGLGGDDELSGSINSARTLESGTYTVTGDVTVDATLTIAPGTTILFDANTSMVVSTSGRIMAQGSGASTTQAIVFKSSKASPAKGDWDGIIVNGNGSVFAYCSFLHADTGLELNGASASVTSSSFESNTVGLDASGAGETLTLSGNAFVSNGEPLGVAAFHDVDATSTFTSNTNQRIRVTPGANTISSDWSETDVPYYVDSGFELSGVLTLSPGVTVSFASNCYLTVATDGQILADGASGQTITFTSGLATTAKGDWDGVTVNGNGSLFDYCEFRYADTGLELNGANASVTNCRFESNTEGLYAAYAGETLTLSGNAFVSNTEPFWASNAFDIDATSTFSGNTNQRIRVNPGANTISTTWAETDVPYYVDNGFELSGVLTLSPGVTVSFAADCFFNVATDGQILADGTGTAAGEAITFTSGLATKAMGDWNGIIVYGSGCVFDYCIFEYADTGMTVNHDSFTLSNSIFRNNTDNIDSSGSTWLDPGNNTYN